MKTVNGESVKSRTTPRIIVGTAKSDIKWDDNSSSDSQLSENWMKQNDIVNMGEAFRKSNQTAVFSPTNHNNPYRPSDVSSPEDSKNLSSKYKLQI